MSLSMIATILTILSSLTGAGYAIWRKRWSPEAKLARMEAERTATEAALKVEAERLQATYTRIDKEALDDKAILDRLNRPVQ